jgi:hypothetical protein
LLTRSKLTLASAHLKLENLLGPFEDNAGIVFQWADRATSAPIGAGHAPAGTLVRLPIGPRCTAGTPFPARVKTCETAAQYRCRSRGARLLEPGALARQRDEARAKRWWTRSSSTTKHRSGAEGRQDRDRCAAHHSLSEVAAGKDQGAPTQGMRMGALRFGSGVRARFDVKHGQLFHARSTSPHRMPFAGAGAGLGRRFSFFWYHSMTILAVRS